MSLSLFLSSHLKKPKNQFIHLSDRFIHDDKEILWEIKALTAKEEEDIRKKAIDEKYKTFDTQTYWLLLTAESVVSPNLKDATLQDSFSVYSATELLLEMLTPGEYKVLVEKAQAINGFSNTMDELVQEAKN